MYPSSILFLEFLTLSSYKGFDMSVSTLVNSPAHPNKKSKKKSIKCLVWDLDNTLWNGVLLEDREVSLRENVVDIIQALDRRGILQSIASKNDAATALAKLTEFGLQDYFLYPQINWNSKAASIKTIAELINIGVETLAFIDDQPFEREEVNFSLPDVFCIDAANVDSLLDLPELNPRFITKDSTLRRQMYLSDIARKKIEEEFVGPQETFLASLEMVLHIFPAREEDLQRAEELTVRTNQLNATGYTYSYEELKHFSGSRQYKLLMARLEDRYGTYGHIGLTLLACGEEIWTLKLMLMSCRVMSRGVGSIMLNHVLNMAKAAGVRLQAEFVPTERNRLMDITYRFAGFREVERVNDLLIFEHDLENIPPYPHYVKLHITDKTL